MGKSTPSAPDPVATANAQAAANQQTATYNAGINRPDQYTPYGSQTYTYLGTNADGSPHYRSDINFTDIGQSIFNQQQQQDQQVNNIANSYMGQIQNAMGSGLDTSGLPGLQSSANGNGIGVTTNVQGGPIQNQIDYSNLNYIPRSSSDFNAAGLQAQQAVLSRLRPELERDQSLLDNKLANQGIMPGSEAWNYEQKVIGQQKNDAYNQAVLAGNTQQNQLYNQALQTRQQLAGESENQANYYNNAQNQGFGQGVANAQLRNSAQQQIYGQNYNNAQLANAARAQGLQEAITQRELPLNEFNALRSASQVQAPQFGGMAQVNAAAPNIQGLVQDTYNARVGSSNAATGGLYGLGGAGLGAAALYFSDKRMKHNIRKIGATPAGLGVYEYEYKNVAGKHTGVIAQEVEKMIPEAVIIAPNGYKAVNYAMVR